MKHRTTYSIDNKYNLTSPSCRTTPKNSKDSQSKGNSTMTLAIIYRINSQAMGNLMEQVMDSRNLNTTTKSTGIIWGRLATSTISKVNKSLIFWQERFTSKRTKSQTVKFIFRIKTRTNPQLKLQALWLQNQLILTVLILLSSPKLPNLTNKCTKDM